jgi:hypothetical protein
MLIGALMVDSPVKFTEKQTLRLLAEEAWNREGDLLVSRDGFSPRAVSQYIDALSQETRDRIKLTTRPDRFHGPLSDAKKLLLDAEAAEAFFSPVALKIAAEEPSPRIPGSR